MKRYIEIEKLVYQEIEKICFGNKKRNGYRHLFGVSQLCRLYSTHFQLDQGLCAIMGLLHDYSVYKNNTSFNHAVLSSELAEKLLNILLCFKKSKFDIFYSLFLLIISIKLLSSFSNPITHLILEESLHCVPIALKLKLFIIFS